MLIGISVPCENLQKQELHVSIVTIVQIQITDEPSRRTALVHGRGAAYVAPVRLTSALLSFMLPFSVPGKVAVVLCVLLRSVYTLETKVAAGNTSSQHSKWQVEHCWGSQLTSLHVEATQVCCAASQVFRRWRCTRNSLLIRDCLQCHNGAACRDIMATGHPRTMQISHSGC